MFRLALMLFKCNKRFTKIFLDDDDDDLRGPVSCVLQDFSIKSPQISYYAQLDDTYKRIHLRV